MLDADPVDRFLKHRSALWVADAALWVRTQRCSRLWRKHRMGLKSANPLFPSDALSRPDGRSTRGLFGLRRGRQGGGRPSTLTVKLDRILETAGKEFFGGLPGPDHAASLSGGLRIDRAVPWTASEP